MCTVVEPNQSTGALKLYIYMYQKKLPSCQISGKKLAQMAAIGHSFLRQSECLGIDTHPRVDWSPWQPLHVVYMTEIMKIIIMVEIHDQHRCQVSRIARECDAFVAHLTLSRIKVPKSRIKIQAHALRS